VKKGDVKWNDDTADSATLLNRGNNASGDEKGGPAGDEIMPGQDDDMDLQYSSVNEKSSHVVFAKNSRVKYVGNKKSLEKKKVSKQIFVSYW
jgi:hypothetical protein